MSFLPLDDREYLQEKGLVTKEVEESLPDGTIRRVLEFPDFASGRTYRRDEHGVVVKQPQFRLAILIPNGYATTKLDSFYTIPHLCTPTGAVPNAAHGTQEINGELWQFWSRHLDTADWRPGIDGLHSYLNYIHGEFAKL